MPTDQRPFSADDLLVHATFLRRLAGDLAGAADAQDVVQDAWVAALGHPPQEARSLRGWLATIVLNLARNRRRGSANRTGREQRAARPERAEPEEIALERLELQRLVGELVVALPAEQRTILYLRYFEGLTPTAIAARLAVPVKTVKTRHTRALAALRARLDERSGGDRAAWLSALAPWARVSSVAAGGIGLFLKLGAAAAVLLAGALTWRTLSGRESPAPIDGARAALTEAREPVRATSGREALEEGGALAPATISTACVLEGTVRLREDGSPLAGVVLEARFRAARKQERAQASTDESGRYRFEWAEPVSVWSLTARAGPTTAAARSPGSVRVSPGETERLDLAVSRGATLEGVVVDGGGQPVAGAEVRAWCPPASEPGAPAERVAASAPDGSFRLEHLGEFALVAAAPGLVCEYGLRGELDAGTEARGLRVVTQEPLTFRGHVVDERGRPIAGARLGRPAQSGWSSDDGTHVAGVRRFQAAAMEAETDALGAFELGPYPRTRSNVRLTHPDFQWADLDVQAGVADNLLVLEEGHALRGVVLGWDGEPVHGARVFVASGTQASAHTDERGRFELRALRETENAFVHVAAEGHALLALQPVRIGPGSGSLELRLQPPRALAGRALDPAGRPVVDALVRLEGERLVVYDDVDHGERTTWEWVAGTNEARTDLEGRFRFDGLHEGEFELLVYPEAAPGGPARARSRSGREDLEIVVDAARDARLVFTGRVTDALTGAPLRDCRFMVMRPKERPEPEQASPDSRWLTIEVSDSWLGASVPVEWTSDGRYRVSGLDPGRLYVVVEAAGYARWQSEPAERTEGEVTLDVRLAPACSIQLVLSASEPDAGVSSASVQFFGLDGRKLWIERSEGSSSDTAHVRREPSAVSGLPREPIRLVASAPGCVTETLELDLGVPPSEPVRIALRTDLELERSNARARCSFAILATDDASLAGSTDLAGRTDLAELREPSLAGRVWPPAVPIHVDFEDEHGNVLARAALRPLADGRFAWRCALGDELQEGEEHGPSLYPGLPPRVTAARLSAEGLTETRIDLRIEPRNGADAVIVLLRRER